MARLLAGCNTSPLELSTKFRKMITTWRLLWSLLTKLISFVGKLPQFKWTLNTIQHSVFKDSPRRGLSRSSIVYWQLYSPAQFLTRASPILVPWDLALARSSRGYILMLHIKHHGHGGHPGSTYSSSPHLCWQYFAPNICIMCWLAAAGCTISPFYEQFLSPGVVMAAAGDWLNGTESSAKKSHGHSCPQSDQNIYSTTILLRRKFRDTCTCTLNSIVFSIKSSTVCSAMPRCWWKNS